jgi:hypothetical protein
LGHLYITQVQVLQEADQDLTNTLPMGAVHSSGDDDEQV